MVKINMKLVPTSVANKVTYGKGNPVQYIVIHETANTNKGADANAHARLQYNGNSRNASWHYTVDDEEVYQSFEDTYKCWHAGSKFYNERSIGIEICVNSDGNFKKAVENAAELTKLLMDKYNIPKANVVQHNKSSGKDCPKFLRNGSKGVTWNDFLAMLDGKKKVESKPTKPSPAPETSSGNKKPNFNTNSIVDFLNSVGEDSSFANRKKLAAKYDIKNYSGTAAQNTQLLNKLKAEYKGEPKTTATKFKTNIPQITVDGLIGRNTVRALQRVLGTVQDGILSHQLRNKATKYIVSNAIQFTNTRKGSLVVKELQKKLGVTADGLLGPATVRAWQRKLGVKVDGLPGRETGRAIQRALNKGKIY